MEPANFNYIKQCQRNWDISKNIPIEDLDILIQTVENAPRKNLIRFFSLLVATDRTVIDKLQKLTVFNVKDGISNQMQVFANAVFVFIKDYDLKDAYMSRTDLYDNNSYEDHFIQFHCGLSAGLVALKASEMGYKTGFSMCFPDTQEVLKKEFNINGEVVAFLGIGYPVTNIPYHVSHISKDGSTLPGSQNVPHPPYQFLDLPPKTHLFHPVSYDK